MISPVNESTFFSREFPWEKAMIAWSGESRTRNKTPLILNDIGSLGSNLVQAYEDKNQKTREGGKGRGTMSMNCIDFSRSPLRSEYKAAHDHAIGCFG
jgi:hypothetical protein